MQDAFQTSPFASPFRVLVMSGPDSTFDSTQSLNVVVNMIQDEQLEHLPILTTDIQEATQCHIQTSKVGGAQV